MADVEKIKTRIKEILNPQICLTVYRHKFPYAAGELPTGAAVGWEQFKPSKEYMQGFYDWIMREALIPLSKLPLETLLSIDLVELLLDSKSPDYLEHSLGLVTILDQQRGCTEGYGMRYTRVFFDPICEKLARQLVALPANTRPDGKQVWLSRGYSMDDWLVRALWFWAPLVHADKFMTRNRQDLKDWLHSMRAEVESYSGVSDPFAPLEAEDDVDIRAFNCIESEGPPRRSYSNPDEEASVADYSFWWIRILNSHFAITDMCGHYPYWIRWSGVKWTEKDKEFMEKTNYFRYDPAHEPALEQVRADYLLNKWRPLEPSPKYEGSREVNGENGVDETPAPGGPVYRKKVLGERGHGPRVRPNDGGA